MGENIEIKRILDILNSKKILIVLILILFTLVGGVYSYKYTVPEYKATSTLLLIPNETEENKAITSTDLTLNSELITTYSGIAKQSKVLKQVINNLELNITEKELLKNIEINVLKDTYIIKISVINKNAEQATNITRELANVFLKEIKDIYNLNNIGIVDEAQISNTPYNIDHKKDIIMFVGIGMVVACLYIVCVYIFDSTIKVEEDIERYLKLKPLGKIPFNTDKKQEIVDRDNAKSYITECINTIRTNILYMNSIKSAKTILITSCTSQEGKSWFSANIATAFAETNKKVLLIDADMRKGRANRIFNVSSRNGLSDYLYSMSGNIKEDLELAKSYIKETQIANLHILTNGTIPPNPSELLDSNNMKELIEIAKNVYDVVIIDAPPCKLVTDSIILSTIVDSTILVANSEKTKIGDLKEVKKSIEIVGGKIIGAVVNKVKITGQTYKKSYYYGHAKDTDKTELKEREMVSVNELIDIAMLKIVQETTKNKEAESLPVQAQEVVECVENKYDITQISKQQEAYLEKMIDTVTDIKVQLNNDAVEKKLRNKNEENRMEQFIATKIEELKGNLIENRLTAEEVNTIVDQNKLTVEQVKEIVNQDRLTAEQVEEIVNQNKLTVGAVETIVNQNKLTAEEVKEIVNQDKLTVEQVEKIVNQNKLTAEEVNEIVNQDKLTIEQVEEIVKKQILNVDYTEQLNKINEMLVALKESYMELSNRNFAENIEQDKIDNENVIDFKVLKKQRQIKKKEKVYAIDDSITFEELEENAFCVIPINSKKVSYDATEDYGSMIAVK